VPALGIAAAVVASLLYNGSIALQALEAREVPPEHGLRPSLLGRLLRNRRWLGATALGLLGWPFEIAALLLAPLTVVQPCIASGLVLLLWLGSTRLGERPGPREFLAVAAIVAGIAGIAWAAPDRSTDHAGTAAIALALLLVSLPLLAPYVSRGPLARNVSLLGLLATLSAGCGYAWTAIASKLLTDQLVAGALFLAALWLATAAASEGIALLSEMSALQRRPATNVAPIMFAVQVLVPVLLAPLIFDETWSGTPLGGVALAGFIALALAGTVLLAGSKAVAAVMESAHAGD
jgi:drug/metabolite transporter (DMT)-like permease